MVTPVLNVSSRDLSTKAKVLRRSGQIPASFYGHGVDTLHIQLEYQAFRKLYRHAGDNTVIDLKIEGLGDKKVLVHRVDYHPVTDLMDYVEFINVRMDEKVITHVPIHLEGQAPAVKEMGGVLIQSLDEIEIKCLPADLIHEVTLSVEGLTDFHAALHVSDISVPSKVEILTDLDVTIASVSPPRGEEPEAEIAAPDVASVQVTSEKQEDAS